MMKTLTLIFAVLLLVGLPLQAQRALGPVTVTTLNGTSITVPTINLSNQATGGTINGTFGVVNFNTSKALIVGPDFQTLSGGAIKWSANSENAFIDPDLVLLRGAANTLALRNGTNAQAFVISRAFTDVNNFSQIKIAGIESTMTIAVEEAGTGVGTLNSILVSTNGGSAGSDAVAIGRSAAAGVSSVSVGYVNFANGNANCAIGRQNNTGDFNTTAIGAFNSVSGDASIGIGFLNTVSAAGSVAIGAGISNSTANTVQIGPSNTAKFTVDASGNLELKGGLILSSPNGTRYRVTVDNAGTLSATALP